MTPLEAYYQKIQQKILSEDPCQEMAMQQLQQVYDCLTIKKRRWLKKEKLCKGFYLWGEIGRGKTYLMDLFYQQLPIPKLRMHFHQFMHEIHAKLTRLQGEADPLHKIAANFALTVKILCLDEFLVHDIGDAMLLSQLLHALFQHGIVLATTANTPPDALYREGLQRERFLPAIQQLKQHLTVFHLDSPCDYRLHQNIEKKNTVQSPIFIMPTFQVQQLFNALTQGKVTYYQPLSIYGHLISNKGYTDDTIWFDFTSICTIPRSQIDYLAIAKRFSTVLISHVKPIATHADNQARLFVHLIDVFYDADINLILVSEACADLYPKGRFLFEFKRTQSRLVALKKKTLTLLKKINNITS